MNQPSQTIPFPWKIPQACLGVALAVAAGLSRPTRAPPPGPAEFRDRPLVVVGLRGESLLSASEQHRLLQRLRPRNLGPKTQVNHVDHALRFWPAEVAADDPGLFSKEELRRMLLDQEQFSALLGSQMPPLLIPTAQGIRVRTQDGAGSSSHVDHTLAAVTEVGTPADFPVRTTHGAATLRALLAQSILDFRPNQAEYEWSILIYSLFLPRADGWTTTEGQHVDFDLFARRIMREGLPRGVCFGNHRLYTLAALLQIDRDQRLLSPTVREESTVWLTDATTALVWNQHADGWWSSDWSRSRDSKNLGADSSGDELTDRILATGHALEWWGIAPEECLPPRATLQRAMNWLVGTIEGLTDEEIQARYPFLTHAGRAMILWGPKAKPQLE